MDKKLDKELNRIITDLFSDKEEGYEFVTSFELFDNILRSNEGAKMIIDLEGNADLMLSEVNVLLKKMLTVKPCKNRDKRVDTEFQSIMQRAAQYVQMKNTNYLTILDVLYVITEEYAATNKSTYLNTILQRQGITPEKIKEYSLFISKNKEKEYSENSDRFNEDAPTSTSALSDYTINLNLLAKKGRFDKLIGRNEEVDRVVQALGRKTKSNPLLIGEPGVGKTAVIEGLAKRIVDKEVPEHLQDYVIYSLDIGSLIAGAKYRGEFEKRFKELLNELKRDKKSVLFIDEIHMIIGAGAASAGSIDVANLLKPSLANGDIRVIGATTYDEQRRFFDKEVALSRRFQVVDVKEPTIEETIKIVKGLRQSYEKHHGITYSDEVIEASVKLSIRYIPNRRLPDKALDIIDEAGAKVKIINEKKEVSVEDIENIVAQIAKIPLKTLQINDVQKLKGLKGELESKIYGQDDAIKALVNAIIVSKAGIGNNGKKKPLGNFLFTGPTGVGKTEVTNQLAEILGIPLLRFDMSEYMEKSSISSLIGSSPGYVGYEQGGVLTNAVSKQPYSILLLDEIEKAHHDIYNILLQVMDNGFLKDHSGMNVDFRNTIIIMTTNAGAKEAKKSGIGFFNDQEKISGENREEEIKRIFTDEFRNRLDKVVNFKSLDEVVISKVIDKKLNDLKRDLAEKSIVISFTDKVKLHLSKVGYNKEMGARPVDRAIGDLLITPLAHYIIFENINGGTFLKVDLDENNEALITIENPLVNLTDLSKVIEKV